MGKHNEIIDILVSPYPEVDIDVRSKLLASEEYVAEDLLLENYTPKRAVLQLISEAIVPPPPGSRRIELTRTNDIGSEQVSWSDGKLIVDYDDRIIDAIGNTRPLPQLLIFNTITGVEDTFTGQISIAGSGDPFVVTQVYFTYVDQSVFDNGYFIIILRN